MILRLDIPQFLDAEAIDLRLAIGPEIEAIYQLARQMPARAFGEEGVFGVELEPRLVIGLVAPVLRDAHVASRDTLHRAVVGVEDLGGCEARENLYAEYLGLPRQPAAHITQAAGIRPLVVHESGREQVRHREPLLPGQNPMLVVVDRHLGLWAAALAPIGDQLVEAARVDHRTRQYVRADFRALFEHAHRDLAALFRRDLLQPDRRRQPRRPRTDDHHVVRHRLAFAHPSFSPSETMPVFAPRQRSIG